MDTTSSNLWFETTTFEFLSHARPFIHWTTKDGKHSMIQLYSLISVYISQVISWVYETSLHLLSIMIDMRATNFFLSVIFTSLLTDTHVHRQNNVVLQMFSLVESEAFPRFTDMSHVQLSYTASVAHFFLEYTLWCTCSQSRLSICVPCMNNHGCSSVGLGWDQVLELATNKIFLTVFQ